MTGPEQSLPSSDRVRDPHEQFPAVNPVADTGFSQTGAWIRFWN